ncbi:FecCD family ABC transporter permease [Clavibacter zhangzhiyongii]|uniref:Iron ABC transporter permease n=1 Tax=Clavibacter zhangzhiyongii TaxID=2768071 RepID=A0A7L7YYU7_9MICO|nr:iron ABC transporter permease [Clavibacter zhangzhiyongii]QOD42651.1 iron ABC transporter permease [Clavibacter zhangzhiyongii]
MTPSTPALVARARTGGDVRRRLLVVLGACLAVAAVTALGLLLGSRSLDPVTVLRALAAGTDRDGSEAAAIVVGQRLPRTLVGLAGGAALAVAGAVIQGHTRNPLADPGLLGVTSGASLAVVAAISLLGITAPAGYVWFAFGGAAAGTAVVVAVGMAAGRRSDAGPASLVLAGAAVSAFLGAATGLLLLVDVAALDAYRFWSVGSLAGGRGLETLASVAPARVLGGALALVHARALDALALGDDSARALGRRLLPTRLLGLLIVTALVGGATAILGSLGFVGLLVPHMARWIVGHGHRALIPLCAALGASLTVAADIVGRLVVLPAELPVGVVLGVLGAPAFIVLGLRARGAGAA